MCESINAAVALLEPNLARHPEKIAIIAGDRGVSYRVLDEQSTRFGNFLLKSGVRAGERIVIAAGDSPEYFFAFLGCLKSGIVPVLVNPALPLADHEYIFCDSEAVALITETTATVVREVRSRFLRLSILLDCPGLDLTQTAAVQEAVFHSPASEGIAFILYSSGSTGKPKGVPHRHRDILITADAFAGQVLGMNEQDVVFSASKLSFAYGLGNSFSFPLRFGATVVLFPGKPDSSTILQVISKNRVTLFFGVPIVYNMLLKTLESSGLLSSLRLCISAGESLPAPIYREWTGATGIELLDGIGSTEALHIYISNRPGLVRAGSAGTLLPPYEVRIVDDAGQPVAPGTSGHLQLRGPSLTPGYWNRPDKTNETMLAGGWFNTGDIFTEEDGWFVYQGRSDDMFKVDAHWVSPAQVESVLREHHAVLECAVTWRRVESLVRPIAYAVLRDECEAGPALERELRRFVAAKLPPYMCPVQVEWIEELPKTVTGKVQRFLLRPCS